MNKGRDYTLEFTVECQKVVDTTGQETKSVNGFWQKLFFKNKKRKASHKKPKTLYLLIKRQEVLAHVPIGDFFKEKFLAPKARYSRLTPKRIEAISETMPGLVKVIAQNNRIGLVYEINPDDLERWWIRVEAYCKENMKKRRTDNVL